jgi:hypothetical protein
MPPNQLPPPAQMILMLGGFRISQALYAAAVLGVPDELVAGPASAEVLAERAGAHPPSLARLLRTLGSVGVFTEPEPGVFALTPLGRTLAGGEPGSMREVAIMFMETHYAPFGDLIHTIRTGQPANRPAGMPTSSHWSCMTGRTTRPGASWPTSRPQAAAAREFCCSSS